MKDTEKEVGIYRPKLTRTQKLCLAKLRAVQNDDGWVLNYRDNIGFQHRVLNSLVLLGLVEESRGEYRAIKQDE